MYSRREILKVLILGGLTTTAIVTSVGSSPAGAVVVEQNLLRNGSFEENGFGRTLSGWTVTVELTEADT